MVRRHLKPAAAVRSPLQRERFCLESPAMNRRPLHPLVCLLLAIAALIPHPAAARVMLSFHSFNGSWLVGRFPHAFVALDGTLDSTGQRIHENFGYSARHATPAVLSGNVEAEIYIEQEKYVRSTNVHFTVPITDAQYAAIKAEVAVWRDAPGKAYSLDHHNCVHFVARIAELVGLKAPVPQNMVRRPKLWLNYITTLNPQLGAKPVP